MLGFVSTALTFIVPFLLVLTLVVTVHELGHFLAARSFGVAIDRFSIGFGRPIVSWRDRHGVEWRIGWIPFGGYVRFAGDENEASVPDVEHLDALRREVIRREGPGGLSRYYHFKPIWQRAVVAAAGPFANFVLAVFLFAFLLFSVGEVMSPPRVAYVEPGSPAAAVGFRSGDLVVRAAGHRIATFEELSQTIALRGGASTDFLVKRGGRDVALTATPAWRVSDDPITGWRRMGWLGVDDVAPAPARVSAVEPGSPAALAGFRPGDRVLKAAGQDVGVFEDLTHIVTPRGGAPTSFLIERAGVQLELIATPAWRAVDDPGPGAPARVGRLGLASVPVERSLVRVRYNPVEAVGGGVRRTWNTLTTTVYYLGRIVTGQVDAGQISGPLGIAKVTGKVAQISAEGAPSVGAMLLVVGVNLLQMAALISVSVGFMNLLPVPILDGGHLLFYAYEAVARRPLAAKVQAAGYRVGLALVLGLMLFATWNDLQQLPVSKLLGHLLS
ncbi:RIP metalloprotease RseP [Phenylobacterium sp.]|uniref:RIP metalloprotease RseP n=1 Tax=Phenylobacterium sp. TaxID=1871053 RepID=UPI002F3F5456